MPEQQEHKDTERAVDRRGLLRRAGTVAAGVAGAGVVTAVAAAPAEAAPDGNVVMSDTNVAGANTTGITNSSQAGATLRLTNSFTDLDGLPGPALRLVPTGFGLTPGAPVGSLSASPDGTLWSAVEFGGQTFQSFVYTSATGLLTVPLTNTQRVLDTRAGAAAPGRANIINPGGNLDSAGRVIGGHTIHINLRNYVDSGFGLFGNLTVVGPLAGNFITLFPFGQPRPITSNINFNAGATLSNFTACAIGFDPVDFDPNDAISIYCNTTTHVIFDLMALIVQDYGQVLAGLSTTSTTAVSAPAQAERQRRAQQRLRQRNAK